MRCTALLYFLLRACVPGLCPSSHTGGEETSLKHQTGLRLQLAQLWGTV